MNGERVQRTRKQRRTNERVQFARSKKKIHFMRNRLSFNYHSRLRTQHERQQQQEQSDDKFHLVTN